jgi:hypothetical protein
MNKGSKRTRYVPSPAELKILESAIHEYFDKTERSSERNDVLEATLPKLSSWKHWTKPVIRTWFTNNQKHHINQDGYHFTPSLPPPAVFTSSNTNRQSVIPQLPPPPSAPPPPPLLPEKPSLTFTEDFLSPTSRPPSQSLFRLNSPWNSSLSDTPLELSDDISLLHTPEISYPPIELPFIPEPLSESATEAERGERKWNLYQLLSTSWRFAKTIKSESNRLDLEKEIELRFLKILNLFSHDLKVAIPRCCNRTVDFISGVITPELQRQTSQTTRIYTNEFDNPTFEQGSSNVKFVRHLGIPDHLQALYEAQISDEDCNSTNFFDGVECDDGFVLLQQKENLVWLIHNEMEVQTSFNIYTVCLIVEDCKVFIAGDHRIECFDLNTLRLFGTLYSKELILNDACLTIWNDWIILGFGHSLLFWTIPKIECDPTILLESLPIICELELSNITSISAVGEFLAIASFDYPVVHIYRLENGIPTLLFRLISHTGGITKLKSISDSRLFTGSTDATIQLWSVQDGVLELQCDRHGGPITVISVAETTFGTFLFTGGYDSMIRAWDCSRKKGMWQLEIGNEMIPFAIHFDPKTQKLMVLSRSTEDLFCTQLNTYTFGLRGEGQEKSCRDYFE